MTEFLAENNNCGRNILNLASRGNAIIAELLRLKDYVPSIYRLESKTEQQKYGDIIQDFSYFKIAESHENKIENIPALNELDKEFRDNNLDTITRFYLCFESIHTYVCDLISFLEDLNDGAFIHHTLENVFSDMEGKQLLCEVLYLYGVMLLVLDAHIEGIIRERLLVSYYRYSPQRTDTRSSIDEVCKFLRDTGYSSLKRPNNYPVDYFKRIPIPSNYVDMVIGKLISDDIYNQLCVYPMSKHRSTALANQAAMLYVSLYFEPEILNTHTAKMREIVDKYFPDNWVISIYMGITVNLVEWWDSFKAAKTALSNTLDSALIKDISIGFGEKVDSCNEPLLALLKEGSLTSDIFLGNTNNVINCLRDANITLRWLMLHTMPLSPRCEKIKKCKQLRELILAESKATPLKIYILLLNTADLELKVKELFRNILSEKETKFVELKADVVSRLNELSEVFSGEKPLTRMEKNVNLQKWFLEISKEVNSLEMDNNASIRKIVQLIQALEEVQEFHQLNSNLPVLQYLIDIRKCLHQMIRNFNIKEDTLITLQIIGDVSYAWKLIYDYMEIMHKGIRLEPSLVVRLRAVFLKLASALEIPLLRINQAHSEDMLSVSQYYSSELEVYIRKVLQIIPLMMFEKMARIIEIQTNVLKEVPSKLEKDKLKEYAQLDERFEFAQLTHSVSIFGKGMRMMKSTLVGVIYLDPKQLLEDGIRRELVLRLSQALHNSLIFSPKMKSAELEQKLKTLANIMDGYKRSFEYIQDYVNINGLKIWQEEVTRIINFNVEHECHGFLSNKLYELDSSHQSKYVPIPQFKPTDTMSENFIGRLAREIIRITDPKYSFYIESQSMWYDPKAQKCTFNKETFDMLRNAIEPTGLVGLNRLYSFMIITYLNKILATFHSKDSKNTFYNIISNIKTELANQDNITNIAKFYQNCLYRTTKFWPSIFEMVLMIGQLQLIQKFTIFLLNMSCKFDASNLESSLRLLNNTILSDILKTKENRPSEESLQKLSVYFDWAGLSNPFNKIYITTKTADEYVSIIFFIFTISNLQKLFLLKNTIGNVNKRLQDQIDGLPFAVGIHTILKQFHSDSNKQFIELMVKYVTVYAKQHIELKNSDLPMESVLGLRFLEVYTSCSENSYEHFRKVMPEELKDTMQLIISA